MGYKAGIDKKQLTLVPVCVDDYIPEDHICRVIHGFTEELDMEELGYKYGECKKTGCQPYDPRMMLGLYIYGYLHRVRSSRRLRDESRRNLEVMWLMDGLRPDDKTICNFRTDNLEAIRATYRAFTRICRQCGLYGRELEATDSTKFRASNNLDNHYNKTVVEKEQERTEKKINEYLDALAKADQEEAVKQEPSAVELRAALERLKQKKEKITGLAQRVAEEGEVSLVDPDARIMRSGGDARKLDVCYNVHTVVDAEHHLIVDFKVTNNASDANNLYGMSEQAKEVLQVEHLVNLADSGYYDGEDIAACEENGVTCLVAKPPCGGPKKAAGFSHDDFIYNKEQDIYICPCQNKLQYTYKKNHVSGRKYRVYANAQACKNCLHKKECTKSSRHREVVRQTCQDTLDIVDERTRTHKALYRKRQEIVEHVFGTVKAVWGYKQYLCRTLPKVTAETSLAYLAYNMRRVVNIITEKAKNPAIA